MERIAADGITELHELVTGVYNLVFADDLRPEDVELYDVDSAYVEAEIELPYVGLNRTAWETKWTPERRLEVLLHEFAHVEEGPDEPDHGPRFYERLAALTATAEARREEVEALFGTRLDFEEVHQHVVDSVNEHTVELDTDTVEERKRVLHDALSTADRAR